MLEDVVVIGVTMTLAEIVKRLLRRWCTDDLVTQVTPLVVLALAGGLNVLNAYMFAPDTSWREALKAGLLLGAVAGGVYSMGKAVLGKS